MKEDMVNSVDGICMSLWFSGCDIHCKGCHNQSYWEPKDNPEITPSKLALLTIREFDESKKYGIEKSLSILGGEPLAPFNRRDLKNFLAELEDFSEHIYIRLWTGRTREQLLKESETDPYICLILSKVNEIIIGPFVESLKKDLPLRGSSNQEILKYGEDYTITNPGGPMEYLKLVFKN